MVDKKTNKKKVNNANSEKTRWEAKIFDAAHRFAMQTISFASAVLG